MTSRYLLINWLLFLPLFQFLSPSQEPSTNRIYWDDWYKLEWADFKAEPEDKESIAALSSIALPYTFQSDGEGELLVNINVCFIKDESWVKKERANNVLLQHEQLHFDIAELHRRKVVKALLEANLTKKNYETTVDRIIEQIWLNNYRSMQDLYDKETNFSQVIKNQIKWNKFVQKELSMYDEYNYTELKLSLINFDEQ